MVAKDIISFATVTDGCEDPNFMEFFQEYDIFDTISYQFSQKMENLLKIL